MEIRVLNYFAVVAEEGNLTTAAKRLHITQPTLSRQIMALEEELGTALFDRGKKYQRLSLTPQGVLFLRRANEILDLVHHAELEVQRDSEEIKGIISVCGGEPDMSADIAEFSAQFIKRHPLVKVNLRVGDADYAAENLELGNLDLGFVVDPIENSRYEYYEVKRGGCWGLLMREDHPLADRDCITPEQFVRLPILHSSRAGIKKKINDWLQTSGLKYTDLEVQGTYNNARLSSYMVKSGMGCAFCARFPEKKEACDGLVFRPLFPGIPSQVFYSWRNDITHSRAIQTYIEELIDYTEKSRHNSAK